MAGFRNWHLFDGVANQYDANFLTARRPAKRLAQFLSLKEKVDVLEIGCGTGLLTRALTPNLTKGSSILATDLAGRMVAIAEQKQTKNDDIHVEFRQMDGTDVDCDGQSFDVVVSALALFGFPDIPAALKNWGTVLRPGGTIAFTSFAEANQFPTQKPKLKTVLERFGISTAGAPPNDINTGEKCCERLEDAGFENISVSEEDLGFFVTDFTDFWNCLTASLFGLQLKSRPEEEVNDLQNNLKEALSGSFDGNGYYWDAQILLAKGSKSA